MIYSMTAFATARSEFELGTLILELRSVNNRYLDLHLRIPEELRFSEATVREHCTQQIQRGKIELRMHYARSQATAQQALNPQLLKHLAQQLSTIRQVLPEVSPPRFNDILNLHHQEHGLDHERWLPIIQQTLHSLLADFKAAKQREGQRLSTAMQDMAQHMHHHINTVEAHLPQLQAEHQQKVTQRLTEALSQASPDGFTHISGEELSARIAHESLVFAMRSDIAEEITRLRSHLHELQWLLGDHSVTLDPTSKPTQTQRRGSTGKRLDFLFQEMNREANTLGSKANALDVTRAAIDLKLLIEQLREQAQNIE